MLETIGVKSVDDLLSNVPHRLEGLLNIPPGMSEPQLLRHISELASKNNPVRAGRCFIGAGAYEHAIPSTIDALISRGEFATAYTPYQPEASQGTLIATFEFQTMIAEITGMDVANASMYDGPSAAAEAALLAIRQTKRSHIIISSGLHPQWREVIRTYLQGLDVAIDELPLESGRTQVDAVSEMITDDTACVIVQHPNFFGQLEAMEQLAETVHNHDCLLVAACNPITLGVLRPPGDFGADIVVGDCQPMGVPLNYGGPYAGFFATTDKLIKQMPGRLAGMAWDEEGRRGFTLTLQAREQHIRRERATSNICTNQALIALASTIYLCLTGKSGFAEVSRQNLVRAHFAAEKLTAISGVTFAFDGPFFNEFVLRLPTAASVVCREMTGKGYWAGFDLGKTNPELSDCLLVCVTETKTREDIENYCNVLSETINEV